MLLFALERFFPTAQSLFEIGCGTGYVLGSFATFYPRMLLVGGEIYVSALKLASSRVPRAEFIQVDVCNLPFYNEFDVIGAFGVLEHIDNEEWAIKQMYQAAKSGGGIIITVPQHQWLWSIQDEMACHKRRYARKELVRKIESAGFQVKWVTSFVSLLLPLMVASRLRLRWPRGKEVLINSTAEFHLPEWFDFLLEKVCDIA